MNFQLISPSPYLTLQQVKDHYNQIGLHFAQTRKKKMQLELVDFAQQVKPGMKVLDVGCGSGRLIQELPDDVYYTGLDFSQVLIDQAKQQFPNRRFLVRDVTTENGWQSIGHYDAIFCLGVLHHIPNRKRQHDLLQQMYVHTKSGGFMVISIWNLWSFRFWKYHLRQWRKKIRHKNWSYVWIPYSVSDGKKVINHVKRFCKAYFPGEILKLVKQVGYKVDIFYYASRGRTHLSIFEGENFCIQAFKRKKRL